jgi:hypothetical protein
MFPAGEAGVEDNIGIAFGVKEDIELSENITLGSVITGKVIEDNAVAIQDEEETTLTCSEFGFLNTDGMSYDEAVNYCSNTETTLPTQEYISNEFSAMDSFSEICGAPTGHYWLVSSDSSSTAWALNSALTFGSTVWSKDREFNVVCMAVDDFVRQPISQ